MPLVLPAHARSIAAPAPIVCKPGTLERPLRTFGPARGVDYTLGRRLPQLVQAAGFPVPEVNSYQPVVAGGENKRLLELGIAEATPAFLEAG